MDQSSEPSDAKDGALTNPELHELIREVRAGGGGFREYMDAAEAIERMRQPVEFDEKETDRLTTERDLAREECGHEKAIKRVEALANTYETVRPSDPRWESIANNIRAALAGDDDA